MKRQRRYDSEFERLFDNALMYAKRVFRKRFIPLTDVEDVAVEAAESVIAEDIRGAFRSAKNREHRWELKKNSLEQHVQKAARARRTQKAMVSLNVFDRHNRLTERFDEDGGDVESEEAYLAERERIVSDHGLGALRVRDFRQRGTTPWWLLFFNMKVDELNHAKPDETAKVDERKELNRLKHALGLTQRKPEKLTRRRRAHAAEALQRDFTPAYYVYHRELAALHGSSLL